MRRDKASLKNGKYGVVIAVGVTIAVLYFGQDVLIPLVLSMLLAFLLGPLCDRLERLRVHRAIAVVMVTGVAFAFILGIAWIVGHQLSVLSEDLPKYRNEIISKVKSVRGSSGKTGENFGQLADDIKKAAAGPSTQATQPGDGGKQALPIVPPVLTQDSKPGESPDKPVYTQEVNATSSPLNLLTSSLGLVLGPLATAGIVFVITFFILLEREDLRDRILRLVSRGKYTVTTIALDDAANRISKYLVAQMIVNGTYGLAIALGLWLIGAMNGKTFPSFVLWGLLCSLLRFIPYIGPWVAAAFPIALSVIVFPGFTVFFVTTGLFVVIELISNNLIEPWLYGSSTGMTTTAVLVSAIFWTWLWGPVGLFLATPLTVCLVVIGKYVNQFEFLDVLLGDQPALKPSVSYYQRLLADDRNDAIRVVETHAQANGVDHVPDEVMIPALRMARRDRREGDLSPEMENSVFEGTAAILRTVLHQPEAENRIGQPLVLGCAAHHASEELVVQMLGEIMPKVHVETISTRSLPSEIEERVAAEKPAVLFIAIVPPGGLTQARYLCRRMRRKFPTLPIVVGYVGKARDFDTLLARFRTAGVRYVATSLMQTRSYIESILPKEPLPPLKDAPSRPVPAQDSPAAPPENAEPLGNV